jgi:hypothetical protein
LSVAERAELARLRRENADLAMERDVQDLDTAELASQVHLPGEQVLYARVSDDHNSGQDPDRETDPVQGTVRHAKELDREPAPSLHLLRGCPSRRCGA